MSREAFEGIEFDWFAIDSVGNIGHFATADYGAVPTLIVNRLDAEQVDQFWSIGDMLWQLPVLGEATGHARGDISDWLELSRRGLFGFDWQHDSQRYCRVTTPSVPVFIDSLPTQLQLILRTLAFPIVKFRELQYVSPEELCDCE